MSVFTDLQVTGMSIDPQAELEQLRRHAARLEADVARLLMVDQLTGLLNRPAFMSRVDAHFKAVGRDSPLSVMIEFGLTGLPRLTGALGRHVGDYLLSALSARLHSIAESDMLCCRLDYRSFAIFAPNISDPLAAMTLAKTYLMRLSEPIDWVDRKLSVEIGAGVALSSTADNDAPTLLQHAGLAYKSATGRGGPGYAFFNPALAQAAKRRSDVITAVQDALEHQYLSLNYQPFFNSQSGELSGFEALIRLNHPVHGFISPLEFIPIAEQAGLISKIGGWALAEACRTAVNWPPHLTVAVNVSPEQFLDGTLMTDIHHALELSSFPAYRLEVEITESTMMGDADVVMSQLEALREMGCPIVLDDFGTGYSSLSYLWKFPFSKLKIDRSFVQAMEQKSRVRGMLTSIMSLSRNLGLKVTAEGIETEAQASLIQDMQCDYIQGYLTGKPAKPEDLAAFIMTRFAKEIKARVTPAALPMAPSYKFGGE
jgi:predicted signal transduction protein with EAL and GGDEF domain